MSDFSDGNQSTTSSANGVTVGKSFDGDGFAVPAIRFELRSTHDESVTVRVTDRIPEDFPMDNVGFHPEYENENWTAYKDHRVQFERTLEPGERLTTVYGIRLGNWQEAEEFLSEPDIEEVKPVSEGDADVEEQVEEHTITDIVSEDSSQVVRDVLSGEGNLPGLDDDPPAEADDSVEEADDPLAEGGSPFEEGQFADDSPAEPSEPDVLEPAEESVDDAASAPATETEEVLEPSTEGSPEEPPEGVAEPSDRPASPPRPGSVAAALADEIRAGEVADGDLRLIQQELDLETPESTSVRLRHVQSRVDDLSAYTEALEEFIDDNGTAQSIVDDFESEVEELRDELAEVRESVESAKDESAQARARAADLETDVAEIGEDVSELGDLGADVDDVREQLDDLEDLVATNTREVSALDDELEDLRDDFDDVRAVEETVESLSSDVTDLAESVSAAESDLDAKVEDVREELRDIESELEEFRQWRSELGTVFGN